MKPLKDFLENFNFKNPSWENLPENFPDCEIDDLDSQQFSRFNAIKTLWELSRPQKISQQTRNWSDPKGYQYLALWQNAALLRLLVRKFTATLPRSEHRLKAQLDDAARSFKRNIEEGWKRPTTSEYLQFLGYSQASLEEIKGDIRDAKADGFLKSKPGSSLLSLGFDLRVFKGPSKGSLKGKLKDPCKPLTALKTWGEPDEPAHPYSQPLKTLEPRNLSCEIFLELINKSDWLARKTVQSLEQKLIKDKKFYEVEQAKIRSNLRFH